MNLLKEIEELSKYKIEYIDTIKDILENKTVSNQNISSINEISQDQIDHDLNNLQNLKQKIESKIEKISKLSEQLDSNEELYKISLQLKEEFETLSLLITFLHSLIKKIEVYKSLELNSIYKTFDELISEIKKNEEQINLLNKKLNKTVDILEKLINDIEEDKKRSERIQGYYIHPLIYKILEYGAMLIVSQLLYSLFKHTELAHLL